METYTKARKLALKAFRENSSKGSYPYLQALDDILPMTSTAAEEDLGIMDIPTELIAGTKSKARTTAFANNFMPLLSEKTEFAMKWEKLYEIHQEEGIRDPVEVYEFMNHFYVAEGNKRVSILKYCHAPMIQASVTRILPEKNDAPENKLYYEYLDFYRLTKVNYFYFSQPGSYKKLLKLLGKSEDEVWQEEERRDFRAIYIRFKNAFYKQKGERLSLTCGDAFLCYLGVYGYRDLLWKNEEKLQKDVEKIWNDLVIYPRKPELKLILDSEGIRSKKPMIGKILPSSKEQLKVAFLHTRSEKLSSWTYAHELGRDYAEEKLHKQIKTKAYFLQDFPNDEEMMKQAITDGNQLIFTTSPSLLSVSKKYAVKYPKIKILNCSLNTNCSHVRTYYGRFYEAKFLTGVIAGIMTAKNEIVYIADYPLYGMIANINAFALGVKMVNPNAKIYLEWSTMKNNKINNLMKNEDISVVSDQDMIMPSKNSDHFGLYLKSNGVLKNHLAMPVWNWGVFYEKIIRSVINDTWKKDIQKTGYESLNYWWGISSGMIDVICSAKIPPRTRQLVSLLKQAVSDGVFHPFSGEITSQDGTRHSSDENGITPKEIVTMDWLVDNIEGKIPTIKELKENAKPVVRAQGVSKAKDGEEK